MSVCPRHYSGDGNITCADAMRSMLSAYDVSEAYVPPMGFWWWLCAFKYLWRWQLKNGVEDLRKCDDCIQRLIELLDEKEINRYDP